MKSSKDVILKNMTNRQKLISVRKKLGLTQTGIAELLAAKTKRPCALRTVQAWEADPALDSSRPCPDWALALLEQQDPKKN